MKKYLPYVSIIGSMLIWSVSGVGIKMALESFTPLTLIVIRFTLAVVLMLLVGCVCQQNEQLALQRLDRKDLPLFMLGGFFQPCLYYLLETYTYDALTSPTIAEALLSTSPLLSPIFAWVLLREKVTLYNIAGIVVSSVGMFMLIFIGSSDFSLGNRWGLLTAFASVSTAILYSVVLRRIPTKYNSLSIVFYIQGLSLLFFYPLWGIVDGAQVGEMVTYWQGQGMVLWRSLGAIGYLAVFSSVAAFVMFCYTVRCLGVTKTNVFNNIRPAFTAIAMLLIFDERLPLGKVIGIIIIIIGLFISQNGEKSSRKLR